MKPNVNLKYWINDTAIWTIYFINIFLDTYFIHLSIFIFILKMEPEYDSQKPRKFGVLYKNDK